jgi:hypothetical protein
VGEGTVSTRNPATASIGRLMATSTFVQEAAMSAGNWAAGTLERDIPPSRAPFWHSCRLDENQMIPSTPVVHHQIANLDQSFDLYVKFEYLMLTRSINAYQEPR